MKETRAGWTHKKDWFGIVRSSLCSDDEREECEVCRKCRYWIRPSEIEPNFNSCHKVAITVEGGGG